MPYAKALWDYKECCCHERKQRDHERQPIWGRNELHFRQTEYEVMTGHLKGECVGIHMKPHESIFCPIMFTRYFLKPLLQFYTLRCWLYTTLLLLSDQYPRSPNSCCQVSLQYTYKIFREDFNVQSQGKCHFIFFWMMLIYHSKVQQAYRTDIRSKGIKQKTLPALEAGICSTKPPVMPVAN